MHSPTISASLYSLFSSTISSGSTRWVAIRSERHAARYCFRVSGSGLTSSSNTAHSIGSTSLRPAAVRWVTQYSQPVLKAPRSVISSIVTGGTTVTAPKMERIQGFVVGAFPAAVIAAYAARKHGIASRGSHGDPEQSPGSPAFYPMWKATSLLPSRSRK